MRKKNPIKIPNALVPPPSTILLGRTTIIIRLSPGGLIQNSTFKRGEAYSRDGTYSKRSFPEGGLIRDALCFKRSRIFTQKNCQNLKLNVC